MGPKNTREKIGAALALLRQGVLSIDDDGRVWRHYDGRRGWLAAPRRIDLPGKDGYRQITIQRSFGSTAVWCLRVHRLIWEWMVGPIPDDMQINHRDFDKANNRLSNLEIVTPQQNTQHAAAGGRLRQSTIPVAVGQEMVGLRRRGASWGDIGRRFGLDRNTARGRCLSVERSRATM